MCRGRRAAILAVVVSRRTPVHAAAHRIFHPLSSLSSSQPAPFMGLALTLQLEPCRRVDFPKYSYGSVVSTFYADRCGRSGCSSPAVVLCKLRWSRMTVLDDNCCNCQQQARLGASRFGAASLEGEIEHNEWMRVASWYACMYSVKHPSSSLAQSSLMLQISFLSLSRSRKPRIIRK